MNPKNRTASRTDGSMDSSIVHKDYLSELPESLMLHILVRLPAKDAARFCTTSKTWLQLWNSIPVRSFIFNYYSSGGKWNWSNALMNKPCDRKSLVLYLRRIQRSLKELAQQKMRIELFRLEIPIHKNQSLSSFADSCIRRLALNYVEELDFDACFRVGKNNHDANNESFYKLPGEVFLAQSLTVLNIRGCRLNMTLCLESIRFPCLEKLAIQHTHICDEMARRLLAGCPSLEKLMLDSCVGLGVVHVRGLPNLYYAYIDVHSLKKFENNIHRSTQFNLTRNTDIF